MIANIRDILALKLMEFASWIAPERSKPAIYRAHYCYCLETLAIET